MQEKDVMLGDGGQQLRALGWFLVRVAAFGGVQVGCVEYDGGGATARSVKWEI